MRKAKMNKSVKVKQHTPSERLAMRRHKRKNGPSGLRRAERRAKDPRIVAIRESLKG
jgi:hypothetical protein